MSITIASSTSEHYDFYKWVLLVSYFILIVWDSKILKTIEETHSLVHDLAKSAAGET